MEDVAWAMVLDLVAPEDDDAVALYLLHTRGSTGHGLPLMLSSSQSFVFIPDRQGNPVKIPIHPGSLSYDTAFKVMIAKFLRI